MLHNRDLALFYADHDRNLSYLLALAHKEFEVRHDVYTWDALAWALYKNGRYKEAEDAIDSALHFGTKDSLPFFTRGMIEAKLNHTVQARESLNRALKFNLTLTSSMPIRPGNSLRSSKKSPYKLQTG